MSVVKLKQNQLHAVQFYKLSVVKLKQNQLHAVQFYKLDYSQSKTIVKPKSKPKQLSDYFQQSTENSSKLTSKIAIYQMNVKLITSTEWHDTVCWQIAMEHVQWGLVWVSVNFKKLVRFVFIHTITVQKILKSLSNANLYIYLIIFSSPFISVFKGP